MLNPEEYIQLKPIVIWMYGLDALRHMLKGDVQQTAYKDRSPERQCLDRLRAEMQSHKVQDDFETILEEKYKTEYRVNPLDSETGELDVDKYLRGQNSCFDEFLKKGTERTGITIGFEFSMEWANREGREMLTTHRECYAIAAECEANQQPCRVIACGALEIPEAMGDRLEDEPYDLYWKRTRNRKLRMYIVVKDYQDPIFPGIWGAFKDNRSTNDFTNVFMDYVVGTRHTGNGTLCHWDISEDILCDEIQLINPRWLTCGKKGLEL